MDDTVTHQNKVFSKVDYMGKKLRNRAFVKCEFLGCSFNKSDLRHNSFEDCHFTQCDFSMAEVDGAGFRNVEFIGCKILGVNFSRCSKFALSLAFTDCNLDYSNFFGTKLRKTIFNNCRLKEVEFTEADLTASVFSKCDLSLARFSNSILEKTDFRTASNFIVDPSINRVKKAKFSVFNLTGLLSKYDLDIDYGLV